MSYRALAPYLTRGWPYAPAPRGARISKEELEGRQQALAQAPLFAGLPRRNLRSVARVTGVRGYRSGANVVTEGAPGASFYVILEGKAKVVRGGRTVARLGPGEFFGEISLLDGGPRTASVVADGQLTCLHLGGQDFREILSQESTLTLKIVRELAKRLRTLERPVVG